MRPARVALWVVLAAGCRPAAAPSPAESSRTDASFAQLRAGHPTRLHTHGPSTGRYEDWPAPVGAQRVEFDSGDLTLWGWYATPPGATRPVPAVVYFHGSFALTPRDFAAARRFLDAGFAVLTPTLRGENGNAGDLELLWGELDDAVAAIDFLRTRPEVDHDRVYAVGHSIGGALSALVSLREDAAVRLTGSVGGIYVPETFVRWSRSAANRALVRFDPTVPAEGRLRTLGANVSRMVHPHVAYIGEEDTWFHPNAEAVAEAAQRVGAPFSTHRVPGDHMTSLGPGLDAFVEVVVADARGGSE
jgi:dienelactone hydrolase